MRYQFLKKHQKEYNIQKACKILRISRSGYYAYLHRRKSKRIIENEALTEIIDDIFHEHQGRYGARRIQQVLLQKNIHVNQKRVSRLMSERGIIPKGAKKKYRYYPNKTQYEERENILGQIFSAKEKNQIWVGDITYIPTKHCPHGSGRSVYCLAFWCPAAQIWLSSKYEQKGQPLRQRNYGIFLSYSKARACSRC